MDTSNFSEEFTKMPPTDSPAVVPPNYDKIFKGYSYVAPSILFSKNAISDDILMPSNHQTDTSTLVQCQLSDSIFFQLYTIDLNEQILGDGSFSVCRRCFRKSTNKEYAVKIVSRKIDCTQEINLLRACQGHPNIVTLHDVYHDEAHTYLVFELLKGGELLGRIRRKSKFTECEASLILRKLVSAVSFMHSRGVVHRDLKPENLLFTSNDGNADIKIVDFGFARLKQEKELLHTPCFTLHYAAPEVLNGDPEGYDENCDLWSLGVILYTMLCGRAPFHARSRDDSAIAVMKRIKEGQFSFDAPAWQGVSKEAKMVTEGLLTVNPRERLQMMDLKKLPWVQGSQSIPQTPLMTPDVLMASCSAEQSLQTTFNAFHKAHKEGFRLQDVLNAKLAQRRRLKKSSSDTSSSSNFSSASSIKSVPTTPVTSKPNLILDLTKSDSKLSTTKSSDDLCSSLKVSSDSSSSSKKDSVFCFGEARVKEYLRTLSSSPISPENYSPGVSTGGTSIRRSSSSVYIVENECTDTRNVRNKHLSTGSSCIIISDSSNLPGDDTKSDFIGEDVFLRDSPESPPAVEQVATEQATEYHEVMPELTTRKPGARRRKEHSLPTRQSARIRQMAARTADLYKSDDSRNSNRGQKRKRDKSENTSRRKCDSPKAKIRKKDVCEMLGIRKSQRLNISR